MRKETHCLQFVYAVYIPPSPSSGRLWLCKLSVQRIHVNYSLWWQKARWKASTNDSNKGKTEGRKVLSRYDPRPPRPVNLIKSCPVHLHSNQPQLILQGLLPSAALDLDKGFVPQSSDVNVRFGWTFVRGHNTTLWTRSTFPLLESNWRFGTCCYFSLIFFPPACAMLTLVYFVSPKGLLLHASLYLQDSVDLVWETVVRNKDCQMK